MLRKGKSLGYFFSVTTALHSVSLTDTMLTINISFY